jgi:DNA polymerase-3 subunit alpha
MFDLLGGGGGASSTVQSIPLPIINESQQDHKEQLAWEKELLGMYVSDHPIARAMDGLDMTGITSIGQISEELNGQQLTFVGMLSQVRRMTTKKGDSMLVAMFEDIEASIEVVVFPKSYEKYRDLLVDDALLRMVAKADKSRRDDKMQLMLESVTVLEASSTPASTPEPDLAMDLEGITDQAPTALPELSPDDVPHPADLGGAPPQEQHMPATPMAPEQTVSIIRPRAKVGANGNGNGNGHSNGNGNGHASAAQGSAQSLRLYFPRTSDFDADVRLMEQVDRLLRQSAGESEVIIHMPSATGVVLLKPRHKVNCDTTLVGALHQVLDVQSVVVS